MTTKMAAAEESYTCEEDKMLRHQANVAKFSK